MVKVIGGDKFKAAMAEISKKLGKAGVVNVGFLEGAKYPDGTSVAMVAAIQEYGAKSIPSRPFFRTMINSKSPKWGAALALALKRHDNDVQLALTDMGEGIAGQLRESIIQTNSPPLSEITLMLRMMKRDNPNLVVGGATVGEAARRVAAGQRATGVSTKPLVDTAHMLNSIDYEVKT